MAGQVRFCAQIGRLCGPGLGNCHADGICGDVVNVVFVVEDDLVEEGSVEDAAFSRFASGVDVAEVGEDVGELVEAVAGVLVAGGEVLQPVFDGVEVGADAVLLGYRPIRGVLAACCGVYLERPAQPLRAQRPSSLVMA
ncbi:MAG: hypothetical protein ACTHYS_07880, partial [Ancrocorticia populi]|uniref:hypothetical protein n=2 Tax=Ancrocorticia populi TaxID=2175228 RepID=UPI003F923DC9